MAAEGRSARPEAGAVNADFRDLIEALLEHDVRFLVVGGIALAAHGLPRATGDMDVWVRPDAANAERVYAALVAFGAPLGELGVNADDFATPAVVTQFGVPPRRIDVLTVVDGLDFDAAWQRRFQTEVLGLAVPFLSLEDMLRNKEHVWRDKDIGDIRVIQAELLRRERE